ncbi:MAG: sel1 repeat family protein [Oxalobacter sp.]|nr:sel1 repeat family protein [Oxalobacter sp.]
MDTGTPDTAIGQLKAKAESEETEAQYQLGICLWEGIGMPVDPDAALEWVILAAGGGHAPAQSWLGSLYLSNQDEEQARFWFEKASLQGDARAMYYLSLIYVRGNVFGADPMLAFEWLKKAAENGFTEAMCKLGIMHCLGHGVEKNHSNATQWFQKAALKGDPNAQILLATAYLTGSGVPQEENAAVYWFNQVKNSCTDSKTFLIMADTVSEGALMPSCRVASYILLSIHGSLFPETKVDISTLTGAMPEGQLAQARRIVQSLLYDSSHATPFLQ